MVDTSLGLMQSGLDSWNHSMTRLQSAAATQAQAQTERPLAANTQLPPVEPVLAASEALFYTQAAAHVIKTADQVLGTTLDMRA